MGGESVGVAGTMASTGRGRGGEEGGGVEDGTTDANQGLIEVSSSLLESKRGGDPKAPSSGSSLTEVEGEEEVIELVRL